MTTYQVIHHGDGHAILEMEADTPNDVPTKVTGDAGMLEWANDLVETGQSVYVIGTGCGSYNQLVRKDGQEEPPMPRKPAPPKMVPRGKPGTTVAKGDDEIELSAEGLICKADEEQQVVYGWAYVTHDKTGTVNVDKSGDFVDEIREIEKSALNFMLTSRAGDTDHNNTQSTTIVESMVFTPEKMEAMGIEKGLLPSGWWIGAKCDDPTWAGYKAGKWKAFSVHGSGTRSKAEPV